MAADSGKFGHIINDLTTHSSNLEFTISGLDLRPAQIKVLVNNVENNSSLKALSMPRKKLTDPEGKEICEKLEKNQTLERLELEGTRGCYCRQPAGPPHPAGPRQAAES